MVPWFTGSGEAVLMMLTSACVGEATNVVSVAVLFALFGSETELAMFGELVMVVPEGVAAFTLTTSGKFTTAPTARVCPEFSVQVNVPTAPTAMALHVQPAGAVNVDARVVFAGIASVNVTVVVPDAVIAVGPLFVIDCVYVILFPGVTGSGASELDTARSACPAVATVIVAVAELFPKFGSGVDDAILAVPSRTVPAGAAAGTFMTMGNVAVPAAARVAAVQVIVPVAPTAGVEQTHPAGGTSETNVAFTVPAALLDVASVNTAEAAAAGPWFVTTAVIVKFVPAVTVGADAVFLTERSACVAVPTVVITVAVLFARFGSDVPDVTLSTSTICVPLGVPFPTFTTTV